MKANFNKSFSVNVYAIVQIYQIYVTHHLVIFAKSHSCPFSSAS